MKKALILLLVLVLPAFGANEPRASVSGSSERIQKIVDLIEKVARMAEKAEEAKSRGSEDGQGSETAQAVKLDKTAKTAENPSKTESSDSSASSKGREAEKKVSVELDVKKPFKSKVCLASDEDTIENLVDSIQRAAGINMVLDRKAVQDGIAAGTVRATITLKVDGMTFKSALNWICRLSGLAWTIQDEAIFITTPDRIATQGKVMRIYDIRDMSIEPQDFPGPHIELVPGEADVQFNF